MDAIQVQSTLEPPIIEAHRVIEHKVTGELFYILEVEHWSNFQTGLKAHVVALSARTDKRQRIEIDAVRQWFWHFA